MAAVTKRGRDSSETESLAKRHRALAVDAECLLEDLELPAFVIKLTQLRRNCGVIAQRAKDAGIALRPHVKTTKCVEAARIQVEEGPWPVSPEDGTEHPAVVASTMAEAEAMFSEGGIQDITLGMPVDVSRAGLARLLRLHRDVQHLRVLVDHSEQVAALRAALEASPEGKPMGLFVAIDCGYGREGVSVTGGAEAAIELAKHVCGPVLQLTGVYSHSGNAYNNHGRHGACETAVQEATLAGKTAEAMRKAGIRVPVVSVGSTPSMCSMGSYAGLAALGVTEVHPGNYCLLDRQQQCSGALDERCGMGIACFVAARVLSHYPERNELLIHAGGTAMHKDSGGEGVSFWGELDGFGGTLVVSRLSQEHGIVSSRDGSDLPWKDLPIGSLVKVYPNHSCMTACMFDRFAVVDDDDRVVEVWHPARGW
jgi:D-serine deaminase-like pyridoxal phosphate-dependent protein